MNSLPASVFILCIVKLQEFCFRFGWNDYESVANILLQSCDIDGRIDGICNDERFPEITKIRNTVPYLNLDLLQERFVYSTFKNLKSGI